MLCQKRDCPREATHALKLGVPGVLDPEEAPTRAAILLGVTVCEECLDEETAEKWLASAGETLRPLFTISIGTQGGGPDFDRAVILGVPVTDPEYMALLIEGMNHPKAN